MSLRHVALYFVVLLLVLAVVYTFSLQFENTGYGLTRLQDMNVWDA